MSTISHSHTKNLLDYNDMKMKILSVIAVALASFMVGACSDNWEPVSDKADEGKLRLSTMGVEVSQSEIVVSRASVDISNYIVTIYKSTDNSVEREYSFSSMPDLIALPVGDYMVEVKSHQVKKAAWDEPLYVGSKNFKIVKNSITDVDKVVCSFASVKVTVNFDDNLRKAMSSDAQVVVKANDEGELVFTADEKRAGFFEAVEGSMSLVAHFTGTVNGYKEDFLTIDTDVSAGKHYIFNYSLRTNDQKPPEATGSVVGSDGGISVDSSVTEVDIDGSVNNEEDNIDVENPNHNGEVFADDVNMTYDEATSIINVTAQSSIASIVLTIATDNESCADAFASLNGVDLLNPGMAASVVERYGLTPKGSKSNDLSVDLSDLKSAMKEFEGTHTLSVSASDAEGNVSEPLRIELKGASEVDSLIMFESALSFDSPMNPDDYSDGRVFITAVNGIAHLYLNCNSTNEDFDSILADLDGSDLAYPGELKETFDGFGLKNSEDVIGKTEVEFDITLFLSLLKTFPDATDKFILKVEDSQGNSKSVTLTFVVE